MYALTLCKDRWLSGEPVTFTDFESHVRMHTLPNMYVFDGGVYDGWNQNKRHNKIQSTELRRVVRDNFNMYNFQKHGKYENQMVAQILRSGIHRCALCM